MKCSVLSTSWAICILAFVASGKPQYQSRIPNGANVPDWPAVGHVQPTAATSKLRNAFGTDFNTEGRTWTKNLCMMDSDGDGRTNGDELGDPDCVWKQGATPSRVTGITNPGVYNAFAANVTLSPTVATDTSGSGDGDHHDGPIGWWQVAHSILMALSFGLVIPFSTSIPYYLKAYRTEGKWRNDHITLMYLGISVGLLGFFIAIFSMGVENSLHGIIGVILMLLVIAQGLLGYLRQKLPSWMRWKTVHSLVGRGLVLLVAFQVLLGYLELSEYAATVAILIGLIHFIGILLVFVALYRAHKKRAQEQSAGLNEIDEPPLDTNFTPLDSHAKVRDFELT